MVLVPADYDYKRFDYSIFPNQEKKQYTTKTFIDETIPKPPLKKADNNLVVHTNYR